MLIVLSILASLVIIVIIGKLNLEFKFRQEVKELFAQSKDISDKIYHQNQLADLPAPVQKYFKHILNDSQPYISYARIKHDGQFKMGFDKDWVNITGEQYATTQKPGFIWKGTTALFVARDMYIGNKGRLIASIFSLYNIIDAKGEAYNQGELLRWLGESVLYPTNFLPSEKLKWLPIDAKTAKLTFEHNGLSLFFICTFNEVGEMIEMETKRSMDEKHSETWVIKSSKYRKVNNVIISTSFDVLWRLEKGDFSYAKFNITDIEYNKPERFPNK